MSSQNPGQRKTRRPSGILKKVISDENDFTSDLTLYDVTQPRNPSQKRFSKRVSFSDANKIKVIERVTDIGKNWQDSLSDSSDAGISALSDVSNLATPSIKKAQIEKSSENVPKALHSLLKAAIISNGENMLNETQGSCAMDISGVSSTSKFSFFDNSKLDFGEGEFDTGQTRTSEEIENNAMVASFYTKDFLRSLQLDRKDNDKVSNLSEGKRYPHVNPPSYEKSIKGAGRKSDLPVMHVQSNNPLTNKNSGLILEDMDLTGKVQSDGTAVEVQPEDFSPSTDPDNMELTCAEIPSVQKLATGTKIPAQNFSPTMDCGDMELTCATIASSRNIVADQETNSGNISPSTDSADMELTCATFESTRKVAAELKMNPETVSSSTDCGDMDFTCAIQSAVKAPLVEKNTTENLQSFPDPGEMEFTCVVQPMHAALTVLSGFPLGTKDKEVEKSVPVEWKSDDMDFTCAVPHVKILAEETLEQNQNGGQKGIAERIESNLSNANNRPFPQEHHDPDDGMEFTCAFTKGSAINQTCFSKCEQTKQAEEQNDLARGEDSVSKNPAVHEDDTSEGANVIEALSLGEITVICDQSIGDMDLTLGNHRPGLASNTSDFQVQADEIPSEVEQYMTISNEVPMRLDVPKSVEMNVKTASRKLPPKHDITQDQLLQNANVSVKATDGSQSSRIVDQHACPNSKQLKFNRTQMEYSAILKPTHKDNLQTTLSTTDDLEELEFASPLKKRLNKIRNSIGLYKTIRNAKSNKSSEHRKESGTLGDVSLSDEESALKRAKSGKESFIECRDKNNSHESRESSDSDGVFVPDSQGGPVPRLWGTDPSQIPESQITECQPSFNVSQSDSNEETDCAEDGLESEDAIEKRETEYKDNLNIPLAHDTASEQDHDEETANVHGADQADALGLSLSLHKSMLDDIHQELSMTKEENITVQEFLHVYAEINMANFKKSRHSIVVPPVKLQPPTTLCDMFEAKYWTPRGAAVREACVELMRKKIEWLEESVSNLEEHFHASNPEVFQIIRSDPDGSSELLQKFKRLATNCKSLGKVFWKRDAMKLHKGLNKEVNTYINENLSPASQELKPCKELLDKTLQEMEEEDARGVEKILPSEPSVEQGTHYLKSKTELELLKHRHQELLAKIESDEERKENLRKRRTELTNRIIESDFTVGGNTEIQKRTSLSKLRSSVWKLQKVTENSLEFLFLSGSIVVTASFEESSSWEWTRKITSFSLDSDRTAGRILPFESDFYDLIHKLWKRTLQLSDLVSEYSNLSGLKNMLEMLSSLVRASHDLLDDKNWTNCRLVCESCACVEETSIVVSFLPPQPGVDGFAVKFYFENGVEANGNSLDCIMRGGFVPVSHEYIMGKRCLDYLGKQDVDRLLNNVEPGSHYLKRAVDALLKNIEYKHWA